MSDKSQTERKPEIKGRAAAKPASLWRRLLFFLQEGIWRVEMGPFSPVKRAGVHVLRFLTLVLGGFNRHRCSLHAASLTYFSLMALVPVLCLTLLLAKTLGAGRFARDQINARFDAMITSIEQGQKDAPLLPGETPAQISQKRASARAFATQAREIVNGLFDKIDHFNVKTLGWIGLLMLAWSIISTLGMVEASFNEIWGVPKPRSIFRRCYLYLFVALVLPLLVAGAASMPILRIVKSVLNQVTGGNHLMSGFLDSHLAALALTLVFSAFAFAFILSFMPNAKVRIRPALEGGLLTALLFGAWLKLCAVAQVGIAKSSALYGSFAFLPIILAWLYVSWEIVLFGAETVYAFQSCHAGEKV